MRTPSQRSAAQLFPVQLVQCALETDHFAGLDRALATRGIASDRVFPDQPPVSIGERAKAVVISDPFAGMSVLASRQARRVGAAVVMVMDGVVEYRNTFMNPNATPSFAIGDAPSAAFLRPALADVVACAGEIDRRVLTALGNHAVATGLPRIAGMRSIGPAPSRRAVLVATANQPWFSEAERGRVAASLRALKDALERMGVEAVWRLRGGLDEELGVTSDRRALGEVMRDVRAVLTTPSTLMVESMLAGRPTAVVHPHDTPLWQPCAWGWRGVGRTADGPDETASMELDAAARRELRAVHDEASAMTAWCSGAAEMIESLLAADPGMMERQGECAALLDAGVKGAAPAEQIADVLAGICSGATRVTRRLTENRATTRMPAARRAGVKPCVVSCVVCDDVPVGGVLTWSERMGEAFAAMDLGYDVRTLVVCVRPDTWRRTGVRIQTGERKELCILDPSADNIESLSQVREAIERLAGGVPAIVLPNYTDITYAAAIQLRSAGSRVLAIAHTDDPYYRGMMETYACWDGGVGVSRACMEWLDSIEQTTRGASAARPLASIHYGVPIAPTPRTVEMSGPLKIAYVGRMVQPQKRISDLLGVIDGLEERGVPYELHMVGEGVDLPAWRAEVRRRRLRSGRVECHGRRDAAWIERFMKGIDVSVLVSEFEGTSISMLEAMGAGVVPVVTAVRSGADEWVIDGQTGVTSPVAQPDAMAARLAELACDRPALARMGRAAWEKARRDASIGQMAERYGRIFDAVRARVVKQEPTDLGVRLVERWRWTKGWAEDSLGAPERVRTLLREAGYRKIVNDLPEPGCDAVIVRADVRPLTRVQAEQIALWRECGLGVVVSPHLRSGVPEDAMSPANAVACERVGRVVTRAACEGYKRIAVYGTGKHTRRLAPMFAGDLPFVGFIDDAPPGWEYLFGLPIVKFERALEDLRPDAVLLSSDAWEEQMWARAEGWRAAGVRVIPVYGAYEETAEGAIAGQLGVTAVAA